MRCVDEHDEQWEVQAGDPAHDLVKRATRAGFQLPRLTQRAIRSGSLQEQDVPHVAILEAVAGLETEGGKKTFLQLMELYDTMAYLTKGEVNDKA